MMNNSVSDTAENLAAKATRNYPEIDDIKRDAVALKNSTRALAEHAVADSKEALSTCGDKAAEKLESVKGQSKVQLARAEEYVRTKPAQSIAAAFLGGLVVSLLLRK
jgi:ElaB/YqjD/DUF883 family membrane-anchored ribosome-binding protein